MDGISLHCNSMAGAHKLDAEKTSCHGRYLDAEKTSCHGLRLRLHMWSDFPLLFQFQNFVPLVLAWVCFCFCFLERMWSCLILWVFCVFVSQENFWVCGLLEIGLVTMFMGLFLGFIYGLVSWIYFLFF